MSCLQYKIILDGRRSMKCFSIFLHFFSPPILSSIRIATTLKENSNPSWFSSCLLKNSMSLCNRVYPSSLELLISSSIRSGWSAVYFTDTNTNRTRVATARLLPSSLHFSFFSSLHLPRISYLDGHNLVTYEFLWV